MKAVLSILCLLLAATSFAADSVVVKKDPRLDVLTAKQAMVNKITANMLSNGQYKGYRLQVLTTRSRDEAFQLKADLLQRFPDQKVYAIYQSPYFKIRFGNFISRADAESYRRQLAQIYSQGIYVIQDAIEYSPSEIEEMIPEP